jgi:hypothetical protein
LVLRRKTLAPNLELAAAARCRRRSPRAGYGGWWRRAPSSVGGYPSPSPGKADAIVEVTLDRQGAEWLDVGPASDRPRSVIAWRRARLR